MAAPSNELAFDFDVMEQAAQNWQRRTPKREHKIELVNQKRYVEVEPKERLAKRANRLLEQVKKNLPTITQEALSEHLKELIAREPIQEDEIDNALFERVIGETRDFLSIEFFDKGLQANRCIGRVVMRLRGGRVSYGTGFLVSPHLLMTNWHVLRSPEQATSSAVEFDYQLDRSGKPLAIQQFQLDPATFFLNDKPLDFALVAVQATSAQNTQLKDLGWCPLIKEEGKITIGDSINIIQHPRGGMKQVVIRESRLLDLLDKFAHYEGDTEQGSSGSPVFNDQWEVVALHHSGVPKTNEQGNWLNIHGDPWQKGDDPGLLDWIANEGVRISRLVNFITEAKIQNHEKKLRDEMLESEKLQPGTTSPSNAKPKSKSPMPIPNENHMNTSLNLSSGAVTITIPLNITVSLGIPDTAAAIESEPTPPAETQERIDIDPDYKNRPGYNPDFLGFSAPLPTLMPASRSLAVEVTNNGRADRYELKYYHYSLIMNRERRLAFVAAVNFDANARFEHERQGKDKWFLDPRIPKEFQTNEALYADNPFDRGHLVRRADAAWGETEAEAKLANDDTFHFTNCSPQHAIFNQSSAATKRNLRLWGNLENHITDEARADNKKLCIFNGPVFHSDDKSYRGILIPREFWKVVVFEKENGEPGALAFLLSQAELIEDLPEEDFEAGEFHTFQLKISELEKMTQLNFGVLKSYDPLEDETNESALEAGTKAVPLARLKDVVL